MTAAPPTPAAPERGAVLTQARKLAGQNVSVVVLRSTAPGADVDVHEGKLISATARTVWLALDLPPDRNPDHFISTNLIVSIHKKDTP